MHPHKKKTYPDILARHRKSKLNCDRQFHSGSHFASALVSSGAGSSLLVRAPDSWSKGCEFKFRQQRRENFFSRDNFVCWLLIGVRFTPVLPQWHVKDPGHSAKSAGGRSHVNTHTFLTQRSRSGLTMKLSRHSVGTYQETSSHATCQGTLSHSRLNSLSHCGLILAKRVELVCAS